MDHYGSLILVLGPPELWENNAPLQTRAVLTGANVLGPGGRSRRLPFVSVEGQSKRAFSLGATILLSFLASAREPLIERKCYSIRISCHQKRHHRLATGTFSRASFYAIAARRRSLSTKPKSLASGIWRRLVDQLDVIKVDGEPHTNYTHSSRPYELLAFRNLSGQLSRRSVDLHFHAIAPRVMKIFRSSKCAGYVSEPVSNKRTAWAAPTMGVPLRTIRGLAES